MSTELCSVLDCGRPMRRYGFCDPHSQRFKNHGDPMAEVPIKERPVYDDLCSVEGCGRPQNAKGYCQQHYKRWRKHGTIRPEDVFIKRRRTYEKIILPDGFGWCQRCDELLPAESFSARATADNGLHSWCKECVFAQRLMLNYKMTRERYDQMLRDQNHVCAICAQPETSMDRYGHLKRLSIDHDHKCCPGQKSCGECVRALLCHECNSAIGSLHEDVDRMRAAIDYITTWSADARSDIQTDSQARS